MNKHLLMLHNMVIRKHINLGILLLAILASSFSTADHSDNPDNPDRCVFNADALTDDFLKENKNIQSYIWSNKDKKAYILLKNGDYVFVKQWACIHYGMEAKKITMLPCLPKKEQTSLKYWQKDMLSFGEQFLDKGLSELYRSVIENTDWAQGKEHLMVNDKYEIRIPVNISYPEFYVMLERREDMVVITIYFYMN